jgi:hypothetical protein
MARDSLFGDRILWSGRPKVASTPPLYRSIAVGAAVVSTATVLLAIVAAVAVGAKVGGMILLAAWCATIALAAWRLPRVWQSRVEYLVTERHVIWRRGALRRSIERAAISYARIRWLEGEEGIGDLELVRAVPTGALRRTLSLSLTGVEAPDRLWAIVRGLEPAAPLGDGTRPLAQRLDDGERVLWSAIPKRSPWTFRRAFGAVLSLAILGGAVASALRAVPAMVRVLRLHVLGGALSAAFVTGVALGVLVAVAAAALVFWYSVLRPRTLAARTRYFVTDRRVLIRRDTEELSLDRSRIAYVISTAPQAGLNTVSDVFLVIDGPQARALAPSGAFGEGPARDTLVPVLASIDDADGAVEVLKAA